MARSSYRILLATVGAASLALPDLATAQKVGAAAAGGESRDGGGESQTEAIFLFGDRMCVKTGSETQCTTNFNTAIIGLRGQPPSVPAPVTTETIQGLLGGLQGSNQGALTNPVASQGAPPSVVSLPSTGGAPTVAAPTSTRAELRSNGITAAPAAPVALRSVTGEHHAGFDEGGAGCVAVGVLVAGQSRARGGEFDEHDGAADQSVGVIGQRYRSDRREHGRAGGWSLHLAERHADGADDAGDLFCLGDCRRSQHRDKPKQYDQRSAAFRGVHGVATATAGAAAAAAVATLVAAATATATAARDCSQQCSRRRRQRRGQPNCFRQCGRRIDLASAGASESERPATAFANAAAIERPCRYWRECQSRL